MNTQRLNITMLKKDALRLKGKPNISAFIGEAVREKLDAEERARKEEELANAYKLASQEDPKSAEDWDGLAGDCL